MKNVTNNTNNIGKPAPEMEFTFAFTGREAFLFYELAKHASEHPNLPHKVKEFANEVALETMAALKSVERDQAT